MSTRQLYIRIWETKKYQIRKKKHLIVSAIRNYKYIIGNISNKRKRVSAIFLAT